MAENSKRKHEHTQELVNCKEEESYENSNDSNPSASETNASSTTVNLAVELDQVLDKLQQSIRGEPVKPSSLSHWSQPLNENVIGEHFRIRRRLVTPDEFAAHYLFAGDVSLYESYFSKSSEIQAILNFAEESTACVNFTETELFLPSRSSRQRKCEVVSEDLLESANSVLRSKRLQDPERFSSDKLYLMAIQLKTRLCAWLNKLAEVVSLHPEDATESTYADFFKLYLEVFDLACVNVKNAKLSIPYKDGRRISCVPNILFKSKVDLSRYCGVVEVKKMTLDTSLRHAFNEPAKGGILSSGEGLQPSKKRRVNFLSEGAQSTSAMEQEQPNEEETNEKQTDKTDDGSDSASGIIWSRPGECDIDMKLITLFFGQLFGSVLALDCCQPHGHTDRQQRLGIGVVGFKVFFCAFYGKPSVPFKDVPREAFNGITVHVTSCLSLLNASDRKEIAKILLGLSVRKPLQAETE